jgi:hypothetical protein
VFQQSTDALGRKRVHVFTPREVLSGKKLPADILAAHASGRLPPGAHTSETNNPEEPGITVPSMSVPLPVLPPLYYHYWKGQILKGAPKGAGKGGDGYGDYSSGSPPTAQHKPPGPPSSVIEYMDLITSPDIHKNVLAIHMLTSQAGSRSVQEWLSVLLQNELVFEKFCGLIAQNAVALSQDAFANYSLQEIVKACHSWKLNRHLGLKLRDRILSGFLGHVTPLANSRYGCRVIGTLLPITPESIRAQFVLEMKPHVVECSFAQNGNHVIQKLLDYPNTMACWYPALQNSAIELGTHRYGCRVLQRVSGTVIESWKEDFTKEKALTDALQSQLDDQPQLVKNLRATLTEKGLASSESESRGTGYGEIYKFVTSTEDEVLDRMAKYAFIGEICESEAAIREISLDKHGNFVMHHLIHMKRRSDLETITKVVARELNDFATHNSGAISSRRSYSSIRLPAHTFWKGSQILLCSLPWHRTTSEIS